MDGHKMTRQGFPLDFAVIVSLVLALLVPTQSFSKDLAQTESARSPHVLQRLFSRSHTPSSQARKPANAPVSLDPFVVSRQRQEMMASQRARPKAARPTKAVASPKESVSTGPRPLTHWPTGQKLIALTYDDGPHPVITPRLIELLRAKGARATFFLLGDAVKAHPKLVETLVAAGMEVANHSDTHRQFTKLTEAQIRAELDACHRRILGAAPNAQVRVMRPPYGSWNQAVMRVAHEMGYKVILWDVDTNDWRKRTTAQMTQQILSQARDGSIILMHDRYQASLKTTAQVIDALSAQGYRFVTVSELLAQPPH